ncbi:MAG: nicotinate-nucleotide--dimethylbenzimidazole phosphoribosyltransferase [Pseudomonadota bacterium]
MTSETDAFEANLETALNNKTKPVGSLGRIEALAAIIARVQGTLTPRADTCDLFIFAADHGIAHAGVSAFPQAVTQQMVLNFLAGGAAANVFAQSVGAAVHVIDAGVAGHPIEAEGLLSHRQGSGTANTLTDPAMTAAQFDGAFGAGRALAECSSADVICCGEMGIGNTSSASLVCAKVLSVPVETLIGRGTGVDDPGLARKTDVLTRAATRTPNRLAAREALIEYGGFEIVMMAGAMVGAARTNKVIVVDGFIATAAALCASHLAPDTRRAMVFAHRSAEAGHTRILKAMQAEPLLELDLRLGEGTGALLAFPLIKSAAAMLRDMASFADAGVSGPA